MSTKLAFAASAALLFYPEPVAAAVQDADSEIVANEAYIIEFNPPLDHVLRYRLTTDKSAGQTVDHMILRLDFENMGAGYRLTQVNELPSQLMSAPQWMRDTMTYPTVFLLDEFGAITGVEDEEGLWNNAATMTAGGQLAQGDPQRQAFIDRFMAQMQQLPEENRLALWAKNITPLLDLAGLEIGRDETIEADLEMTGAYGPVPMNYRIWFESDDAGVLHLQAETRVDEDTMKRAINQMADMLEADGGDSGKAREAAEKMKAVEIFEEYRISNETGLPIFYRKSVRPADGSEPEKEVMRLELID